MLMRSQFLSLSRFWAQAAFHFLKIERTFQATTPVALFHAAMGASKFSGWVSFAHF
jgi:hypothetical protein